MINATSDVEFAGHLRRFAQQVVWYGRKGGKLRHNKLIESLDLGLVEDNKVHAHQMLAEIYDSLGQLDEAKKQRQLAGN